MHLCECGCGLEVKEGNRFIHGHNSRGRPVSDETRKKIGDAQTGEKNHNFGKHCTEEHKKLLQEIALNNGNCPPPAWGRPVSKETREKIGDAQRGEKNHMFRKVTSDETKKKISESKMGIGKSEETRRKMSASQQRISYDEWTGYAPKTYCEKFDDECRESNREKYDNECFLCGKLQSENVSIAGKTRKLSVHHIDMNKNQGCDGNDWKLVPLCMGCHGKAHSELWSSRIVKILESANQYLIQGCD